MTLTTLAKDSFKASQKFFHSLVVGQLYLLAPSKILCPDLIIKKKKKRSFQSLQILCLVILRIFYAMPMICFIMSRDIYLTLICFHVNAFIISYDIGDSE